MIHGSIPSPSVSFFMVGPIIVHYYALCLLTGVIVAAWVTGLRLTRRGINAGVALDVAIWAVPAGTIGGRVYHVVTHPHDYFYPGANLWVVPASGMAGSRFSARSCSDASASTSDAAAQGSDFYHCRCADPRNAGRSGLRTLRQLLQPGTLRAADDASQGFADHVDGSALPGSYGSRHLVPAPSSLTR